MKIYLANPRGLCAGVERAIEIAELSLRTYGARTYLRYEIVHNRHIVNSPSNKGATFVGQLEEAPPKDVEKTGGTNPSELWYVTQTTLSVDEGRYIVDALHHRFPSIKGPQSGGLSRTP